LILIDENMLRCFTISRIVDLKNLFKQIFTSRM
jgi:hypothetical protein